MVLRLTPWRFVTIGGLLVTVAWAAGVSRLSYGTYLPSSGTPNGVWVAVDRAGDSYVAWGVTSPTFIEHFGSGLTDDSYVTKVSADGQTSSFTTHIKNVKATSLTVDPAGGLYLVGIIEPVFGASGQSTSFSTTPGAFQRDSGDGFIVKLAADGSIIYASRISAQPRGVAVDASGAAYLTGIAKVDFRITPGAFKPSIGESKCGDAKALTACTDAFAAKVSADGSSLLYATFLGGTADDSGLAIAVDSTGSVYVVGETTSSDLPTTPGAWQPVYGGSATNGARLSGDGFAARLDPSGQKLVYATFLGGSNADVATGVAVDANQNAFIIGTTGSPNFPVTDGAFQTRHGGSGDAFLVKLGPSGLAAFSSFLGGPGEETGGHIMLGPGNRVYMTVGGPLVRTLDRRLTTPCDPQTTLVAIDRDSGKMVDFSGIGAIRGLSLVPDLVVDASGLVHVAGTSRWGWDFFAATPDAMFKTGGLFLARVDFSRSDTFVPECAVNAASYAVRRQFGGQLFPVAPGEIISIFGIGLGPKDGVVARTDPQGVYLRELSGVRVRIGDTPLPLLYASDSQVNAIVPYSLNAGVYQINARIPEIARAGAALVVFRFDPPGFDITQEQVYVSVQTP